MGNQLVGGTSDSGGELTADNADEMMSLRDGFLDVGQWKVASYQNQSGGPIPTHQGENKIRFFDNKSRSSRSFNLAVE
jgi:hypothetical protein